MRSRTKTEKRDAMLRIISDNLTTLREKRFPGRGGSKRCAEELGMKQQQWSPWENGVRIPNEVSLERIASFFGVTQEYILTDHSPALGDMEVPAEMGDADKARHPLGHVHLCLNQEMIAASLKDQILPSLRLNNVKAVLKLEFSVLDVEFLP